MKETIRKKPVKGFLLLLEIAAFTIFCFTVLFLFYAEGQGFQISRFETEYEDSSLFYGRLYESTYSIMDMVEAQSTVNGKTEKDTAPLAEYSEGNTNLTYLVIKPDEKKVYTNKEDYKKFANYEESLADMQCESWFVVVKNALLDSYGTDEVFMIHIHDMLMSRMTGSFILALSVNQDYPIPDTFRDGFLRYQEISRWIAPCMLGAGLSLIGVIFGLILLTIGAGRKTGTEVIQLNWFDRWYTEIGAFVCVTIWGYGLAFSAEFFLNDAGRIEFVVGLTAFGTFSIICFLWGYLSLVRRIKAKTLWSNSMLLAGIRGCGKGSGLLARTGRKIWDRFSPGIKRRLGRVLQISKRGGGILLRFVKEGFLDQMGDLAKICAGFGFFLLIRVILEILFEADGGLLWFLVLLIVDVTVFGLIVYYAAGEIRVKNGLKKIAAGELDSKIDINGLHGYPKEMAEVVNQIGDGLQKAVQESVRNERMKTELITNVSHDIKTPLTSIINYVDLLKRENLEDPKVQGYISVLEEKAQRLKILTEDVVEASKASTGNITLEMEQLDFSELVRQVYGEYEEKLKDHELHPVFTLPEQPVMIRADGRRMWRVLSNIFSNAAKYSLEGTRLYADLTVKEGRAELAIKNISRDPLNISADELTERFVRGDQSRSTEGSGLGLSIAKSFTELMGGTFTLSLDGDLFKVLLSFPLSN